MDGAGGGWSRWWVEQVMGGAGGGWSRWWVEQVVGGNKTNNRNGCGYIRCDSHDIV